MKPKHKKRKNIRNGFLFLGIGLGFLVDQLLPGIFIGLGLGYIIEEILNRKHGKR